MRCASFWPFGISPIHCRTPVIRIGGRGLLKYASFSFGNSGFSSRLSYTKLCEGGHTSLLKHIGSAIPKNLELHFKICKHEMSNQTERDHQDLLQMVVIWALMSLAPNTVLEARSGYNCFDFFWSRNSDIQFRKIPKRLGSPAERTWTW